MKEVTVTKLNNGEVLVESDTAPDIRFGNQELAHTWLARNGYKIIKRYHAGQADNISGTYYKPAA